MTPNIANYVQYYDPAKAHHRAFLQAALSRLIELDPEALSDGGELREVWLAAVETKPPSPTPNPPSAGFDLESGLKLIREFEGCRLKAYLCPAKRWTIGWGNTSYPDGRAVKEGDLITQEQADRMLLDVVKRQVLPALSKTMTNPLPVPWYSQLDSETDQARRMCFSSSCAMLLAFMRPGILRGPNGDDEYLARVRGFGDTTSAIAQVNALRSYEIEADFIKNADFALIEKQIDRGFPVPCGYLHRGPVHSPTGGGHWLIVVGYTRTHVIVHDPLGEADLIGGATINRPARFCRYSKENFGRRWMVRELGGGRYRYEPGNGWAIVARR